MDEAERREMDARIFETLLPDLWVKQARVVGTVIVNQPTGRKWRDIVVSERIQTLAKAGRIEVTGEVTDMRSSEIRLPAS